MPDGKNSLDVEEAAAVMEQDRRARVEACGKALQEVLTRYRCELTSLPQFTADGRVVAVVQVVAR